jgi:ionotropic kainate glutamate receptor 2
MMKYLESDDDILSIDNDLHLEKVLKENYAYIVDSSTVKYLIENCSYVSIPDKLPMVFPYALGFRKHSAYTKLFTDQ